MSKVDRKVRLARRRRNLENRRGAKGSDPSQNLHVERGAAVTIGEVRAFAMDGHPACRPTPGLAKDGRPCKCATRRFFRKHPEVIVDNLGNAWWPASAKPADPLAVNLAGETILGEGVDPASVVVTDRAKSDEEIAADAEVALGRRPL